MFNRFRNNGPAILVPAAWTFVALSYQDITTVRTLTIAHGVMTVLLVLFAVFSYRDMKQAALRTWWYVVVIGVVVTLTGLIGLLYSPLNGTLPAIALGGWMILPAVGFIDTGRRPGAAKMTTIAPAVLTLCGAGVFYLIDKSAIAQLAGLTLVGLGQTIGIADAVWRY